MKPLLLTVYFGLFAADGVTSHIQLDRGKAEAYLSQSPWIDDGIIVAQSTALYWITERRLKEHPKIKWTIRLSVAGIHGAYALRNAKQ